MDPNQAWRELADAVERDDWELATERAESLAERLGRGGAPPAVTGKSEFDRVVVISTVSAVATWEIE